MRLALTLSLFVAMAAGIALADENITVYQLAGTVQCSQDPGVAPDKAADLLRAQGVKVVSARRAKLPVPVTVRCGAPTGEVNLMEVPAADWSVFSAQNPDGGGYGIWVFEQTTVDVYKYDGTLQCGLGKETPLATMTVDLTGAEIEVLASRKDKDGLDHIAVCGASTGAINVYTIPQAALDIAESIGFDLLVTRDLIEGIKPQTRPPSNAVDHAEGTLPSAQPVGQAGRIPLLW